MAVHIQRLKNQRGFEGKNPPPHSAKAPPTELRIIPPEIRWRMMGRRKRAKGGHENCIIMQHNAAQ